MGRSARGLRGFTVVEVLIALLVASMLTVFVLSLTRTQLVTYEMQGQTTSVQQNARAGFDYVEAMLRRACSGLSWGAVGIRMGAGTVQTGCFTFYDGAVVNGGRFTSANAATLPDAVEVIYGDGSAFSAVTAFPTPGTATVADVSRFNPGDLVLMGDYQRAYLLQIAPGGITVTAGSMTGPQPPVGNVTFTAGTIQDATFLTWSPGDRPWIIMRARSQALYVDRTDPKNSLLMLDPDGPLGADHLDAQPLVEGVEDFQIAVGVDRDPVGVVGGPTGGRGVINEDLVNPSGPNDEWIGNSVADAPLANPYPFPAGVAPLPPWLPDGNLQVLRQLRVTLYVRTTNQYPGAPAAVGPAEDRDPASYPVYGNAGPRRRQLRMVIAPRAWNAGE
jgi:hypothetical protein